MCTREPRLVLVSLLIGWKNGARTLNQSLSELIINQSNYLITFDTQLKTALLLLHSVISSKFSHHSFNQSWLAWHIFPRFVSATCNYLRVLIGLLDCLRPFWLAKVITLVLVLRHSIETRSISSNVCTEYWKCIAQWAISETLRAIYRIIAE